MKFTIVFLILVTNLNAQFYEQFECPVIIDGKTIEYPFTGGFNNPQFSEADFNQDGLTDLFVFDKLGDASMVFLRNPQGSNTPFRLTKTYNQYLPLSLDNFCYINDFNRDGVLDLFTSGIPIGLAGIMLFEGSFQNGKYDFRVRRMGRPEGWENGLWNRLNGGQVYLSPTDLPAIIDIDFDGDLDILTFDSGGSYVTYNRNFQVENNYSNDTMDFKVDDICFGKFEESGLSQTIELSSSPEFCASGPTPRLVESKDENITRNGGAHSGSTITGLDNDEDGDIDLLLGDLTYEGLVYLSNGGPPNDDHILRVDESFPSDNIRASMSIFLASFNVDVDGDNLKDLLVAPNSLGLVQDFNSIWYYKNQGPGANQFQLIQKDFIQNETIDFGSYTSPVFVDYNADGLMDILVGQGGSLVDDNKTMSLVLFENIGSSKDPIFEMVDNDYLDFSQFITTSTIPAPCFGDLDNDGDLDLLIGEWEGRLYYYENIAGPDLPLRFANPVYNYMNINVGPGAKPQIIDFNNDGLMDLVIGEERTNGVTLSETGEFVTGNINYFQNIGTPNLPMYDSDVLKSPNFNSLGRIKVSFAIDNSVKGAATPFLFYRNGILNAVVGSKSGRMAYYEFDSNDPTKAAIQVNDYLGFLKEGEYTSPSLYDINDDGLYELLVGNARGGLSFHLTDISSKPNATVEQKMAYEELTIFPNPGSGLIRLALQSKKPIEHINVYNLNGQLVLKESDTNEVNLGHLSEGVYFINVIGKTYNINKQFIKTK